MAKKSLTLWSFACGENSGVSPETFSLCESTTSRAFFLIGINTRKFSLLLTSFYLGVKLATTKF